MLQKLTGENINNSVMELTAYYEKNKINKRTIIQNTLAFEEVLLEYRDHFGEEAEYSFDTSRKLGVHHAKIVVPGEMFNPSDDSENENEFYINNLLSGMGVLPTYSYRKNTNHVDIKTERHKISPLAALFITVALSIILGLIAKHLIPDNIADVVADEIFRPLSNTFASLINAVVGPVIFFTIVVATINIGDLSSLKKFGKIVLRNLFLFFTLFYIISIIVPVLMVGIDSGEAVASPLCIIRDTLLSIFPSNIITSFQESSVLQLMFWGVAIGLGLLACEKQNSGIAEGMNAFGDIFNRIMSFIGTILPAYIFICIFLMIYDESENLLRGGIVVVYYLIGVLISFVAMLGATCFLAKVSPKDLVKYSFGTVLRSSMACSSLISLGPSIEILSDSKKFDVERKNAEFITSVSQALFKPGLALNYFAIMLGVIKLSNTPLSLNNLITLILMCMIFAVASPPCVGGGLAVYTILFPTFHIDMNYFAFAVTMDALFDYINSGYTVFGNYVCTLIVNAQAQKKKTSC